VSVVLVDQPWVVAGRRIAGPPAVLDLAWPVAVEAARGAAGASRATPLVVGGRSAGARVAARTVAVTRPDALLLLAFPLVPLASRSDADHHVAARDLRRAELRGPLRAGIPVVVAQGERDPFGAAKEVRAALGRSSRATGLVVSVGDADHALRTRRGGPDPAPALIAAALRSVELAGGA
jgi:predicted alpha/beta-hydrolase family hydrolase